MKRNAKPLLEAACKKASEVLGETPFLLIGCTLRADGLPNSAQPASTAMTDEQIVDLRDEPLEAFHPRRLTSRRIGRLKKLSLVAANAKADRMWREMRNNLDALSRVAASYPAETAGDRLVRDCIFLVFNQVS